MMPDATLFDGFSENTSIPDSFAAAYQRLKDYRLGHHLDHEIGTEHPKYAWALSQVARCIQPRRVLEIGVRSGGGAYGLIDGMPQDALFVGVDTEFSGNNTQAVAGMSCYLQVHPRMNTVGIVGGAEVVIPLLSGHWDLVHVDHEKDLYPEALRIMIEHGQVDASSVCVFHDTGAVPEPFVSEILPQFQFSRSLDVHQGATICWGWKG